MAGDDNLLRKRKSPSSSRSRPSTRGASVNGHADTCRPSDTVIYEIDKSQSTDSNSKTRKNVLFQARNRRNSYEEESQLCDTTENRLPTPAKGVVRRRLQSAMSYGTTNGIASPGSHGRNGIAPAVSLESDSPPRLSLRQRRSVSAHPSLRTPNSVTQSNSKPSLNGPSSNKSCLSPRNSQSDDQPTPSSRSSYRNRQRGVERLTQKSSSPDSSDSEDDSPRPSSRPISQPLSPEVIASMTSFAQQNKQAWNVFSTHVKLIDDSTGLISRHPRKTFSSSSIFQKAMHDLYGNAEYGKSRGFSKLKGRVGAIAACASRLLAGAKRANLRGDETGDDDDNEDMEAEDVYAPSPETVANAQRGWRILRQYVQETAAEKRMSQSTLTWNMLTHTIRGLSNMEKTRYELYQKYGLVPMVLSDGTVIQENTMLSQRARDAMAAKSNSKTTPPPTPRRHHSASVAHGKTQQAAHRAIGGFKASLMRAEMA